MSEESTESAASATDPRAPELLAAVYDDVRRVARRLLAGDSQRRALQPTELANEAALRLIGLDRMAIRDGGHMLALAAQTMRRILIDEGRKAGSAKRQPPPMLTRWPDDPHHQLIDLHDLDRALTALDAVSPEHAQAVELRFMLGLTVEEACAASGVPERTLKRRWQTARAWLLDYLDGDRDADR